MSRKRKKSEEKLMGAGRFAEALGILCVRAFAAQLVLPSHCLRHRSSACGGSGADGG